MDLQLTVIKLPRCETKRTARLSTQHSRKINNKNTHCDRYMNTHAHTEFEKTKTERIDAQEHSFGSSHSDELSMAMAWIRNKIIIELFYTFFSVLLSTCFSIQLLLAAVAVLLINQIRIEIIFRIHMPGRINQKRERKIHNNNSSRWTLNNNNRNEIKKMKQQSKSTKQWSLV